MAYASSDLVGWTTGSAARPCRIYVLGGEISQVSRQVHTIRPLAASAPLVSTPVWS